MLFMALAFRVDMAAAVVHGFEKRNAAFVVIHRELGQLAGAGRPWRPREHLYGPRAVMG
jgi:hypothetical protein